MAWKPYHNFLLGQFNGNAVNLDAAGDAMKMAFLTASYIIAQATDTLFSGISVNEVSGTGYTAGGAAIATPTVSLAGGIVTFDGADITFLQNAAGFSNAQIAVVYVVSTGKLICYNDFGSSKANTAADLEVQMDAAGLLTCAEA